MINLRYHIISLVAVFLALGIGILMGSTVIDQGLVSQLRGRTNSLAQQTNDLRAEKAALERGQELWETFGRQQFSGLMKGKLAGKSAILIAQGGADDRLLDGIADAIVTAGASVAVRIVFTEKWGLKEDTGGEQLALALGIPNAGAGDLWKSAAGRIAGRLGRAGDLAAPGDLIASLRDAGFLTLDASRPESFPPPGAFVVVVAGAEKDAQPPQSQFFMPFLGALVPARSVSVAEPLASPESLADRVRGDAALRSRVATIDDADIALGRIALVYALRSLTVDRIALHYGARRSATALVPESLASAS